MACCAGEISHFPDVVALLERPRFPYQRTHDAVLGITLRRQGVRVFYTRNVTDFADCGFAKIVNPID